MKVAWQTKIAGFDIVFAQHAKPDRFRITYGQQVMSNLTYTDAAHELGCCIMHALTCDGKIEDDLR